MKYATTFGSSSIQEHEKEYQEGVALGKFLVEKGYAVKCGGYQGLMEAVSRGVHEAGGRSIGVCLEFFESKRPSNPYLSEKIITTDLYGRLKGLIDDSELFIIQKGSLGTLNELLLIWTTAYIGLRENIRMCLIGAEWQSIRQLQIPIEPRLWDMLEFYDDFDHFKQESGL